MSIKWFNQKLDEYSVLSGYQKPAYHAGTLKLDSNENFVINRQFQQEIIDGAKKNSDIRRMSSMKSWMPSSVKMFFPLYSGFDFLRFSGKNA